MSSKEKKRKNDNNLKEQLKLSLKSYRNSFSAQTTPDLLVDLNDYNANLLPLLKNSLTNNNNQISIIYGFPGFGRKCSIDYCLNSLKETYLNFKKLYIDASVFGTEDSFINCLLEQLYNKKIKKKSEELSFSDLFKNFLKTNKKEKIVFVIDEAECLASPKKQTILYSLLEWIRNENNGILLFFLTNNIMFSDLLEKRVKSRLSQTSFYFFSYSFEKLIEAIKKRVFQTDNDVINNLTMEILSMGPIDSILKDLHSQNKSIGWMLSFLKTMFCVIDLEFIEFEKKIEFHHLKEKYQFFLNIAAKEAKELLIPSVEKCIDSLISLPKLLILASVTKMVKNNQMATFNEILNNLNNFYKKVKNSSLINKIQYSEKILSQAFEELNQCFFLKLDGNKDIYENCKNEWRTNQIILNLPFDEVEKYINDKKANLPTAFGDFYDFVE